MSLINNIKFNYNIKLMDEYFENKKYDKALATLAQKNERNFKLYFNLLKYINSKYLTNHEHEKFYKNKINWIVTFDNQEAEYINKFLNFYFDQTDRNSYYNNFYPSILKQICIDKKIIDFGNEIKFEGFINFSNLFQTLILIHLNKSFCFLNTQAAFFESTANKYFTYPNISKSYLFIIRDPRELYLRYKTKYQSANEALNELHNFDNRLVKDQYVDNNLDVFENRQSWNIHTKSWIDPNVKSTFNGKIINYTDLLSDPEDQLISILYHLKESGNDIQVDYKLVREFLNLNLPEKSEPIDFSKNEEKLILRDLDRQLLDLFRF